MTIKQNIFTSRRIRMVIVINILVNCLDMESIKFL
nr:MAG TPA: hypothetical protein [Caudoviricetes sp.]